MYKKLNSLLTKHDKKFLLLLIIFSVAIALIETIGIAAIMPFISVASDFGVIQSSQYYRFVYELLKFKSNIHFIIAFGTLLVFFYIIRGVLNILYFYLLSKFSKGRTHLLAFRLFENYLGMNYHQFIARNSSELSKSIINETQYLTVMISAILLMISEIFVVVFIYSAMLYVNWKITVVMTLFLALNALFLVKKISPIIKKQGSIREEYQKKFFEIINSTFGNFKIIKLQSNDKVILDKFSDASYGFAKSGITNETLSHFPRIFLETLGFGLIALVVIYLVFRYESDISSSLGILSMFILGLYRLMPSANRLLTSYNQILYYHKSLDVIHNDLMYDGENLGNEKVSFNEVVKLSHLNFGYSEEKRILENINLEIIKGERIAFIGPSGSGKSTLVDIIIGLYRPLGGDITVDGTVIRESNIKDWRKKVGYIPQSVYLFDGTVAENIAFGKEFDEKNIKEVLEKAKILDFLETHQDGIHTFVGEGGIKLSGGQKQRIAIARALYQEPEILVLDEATSALDEEIEKEIMDEIYEISQNKTLIIIAHRLSTINRCEKVYKIENWFYLNEKKIIYFNLFIIKWRGRKSCIYFIKEKYDISLYLMNDTIFYEIPKDVKIVYLEKSNPNESPIKKFIKLILLAIKYKKINNSEISLSFMNRPNYINILAKIFGMKSKVIISERAMPSLQHSNGLQGKVNRFLIKNLYKYSDVITANSLGNSKDLIENFCCKKVVTMNNIFDTIKINELSNEKISFRDNNFTFITVGRLDNGKNHSIMIDAIKSIDAKLYIIGDGELRSTLQNKIIEDRLEDKVIFLDRQINPYKYISQADCFLFSSSHEGYPNVLVEALICGLPIISTDCKSGPREILAPNSNIDFQLEDKIELCEYGILVPINNKEKLKESMNMIINDEELRNRYKEKSKIRADFFRIDKIIKQYEEIICVE